jgi:hypothetical protein
MLLDKLSELLVIAIATHVFLSYPAFAGHCFLKNDSTMWAFRPFFLQ